MCAPSDGGAAARAEDIATKATATGSTSWITT